MSTLKTETALTIFICNNLHISIDDNKCIYTLIQVAVCKLMRLFHISTAEIIASCIIMNRVCSIDKSLDNVYYYSLFQSYFPLNG